MIVDMHSHILPGMDDGAKSTDEAVQMLLEERRQGVDRVVLTPHFYRERETCESFLKRRQAAFVTLKTAVASLDVPELVLGAEVAFTGALLHEDAEPLCIEDTDTLLLEMPYSRIDRSSIRKLKALIDQNTVKIVLAHIERFRTLWKKEIFDEVMELPVYRQINCGSVLSGNFFQRRSLLKMIENGSVHVFGTDAHNCDSRPVNYKLTAEILQKKGLSDSLENMMNCACSLTESRLK